MKFDESTSSWMAAHIDAQTTIVLCSCCGLFYKPILGHRCRQSEKGKQKAPARSRTSDKRTAKGTAPQAVPILSESEGKCNI